MCVEKGEKVDAVTAARCAYAWEGTEEKNNSLETLSPTSALPRPSFHSVYRRPGIDDCRAYARTHTLNSAGLPPSSCSNIRNENSIKASLHAF